MNPIELDPTPAVYIDKTTAASYGLKLMAMLPKAIKEFEVRPYYSRGEIKGYTIVVYPKSPNLPVKPLTNTGADMLLAFTRKSA